MLYVHYTVSERLINISCLFLGLSVLAHSGKQTSREIPKAFSVIVVVPFSSFPPPPLNVFVKQLPLP